MATVTENYRIAVLAISPSAKLQYVQQDRVRLYQVYVDGKPVTTPEGSPLAAWREAQYHLINPFAPGKP